MKKLFLFALLTVAIIFCASCGLGSTLMEKLEKMTEETIAPPDPETVIITEYVTMEPETVIKYVTAEPETIIVTEYLKLEDPVGYLKDHVTLTGVLGADYSVVSWYGPRSTEEGLISANHKGMDFAMEKETLIYTLFDCLVSFDGYSDERGY